MSLQLTALASLLALALSALFLIKGRAAWQAARRERERGL